MIINKKTKILISLFCVSILVGIFSIGESRSSFFDSVIVAGNVITAGQWDTKVPDPPNDETPDKPNDEIPDKPKVPKIGTVIINEIHWAGSPASSNDQWIELHNTTNEDISLRNWTIENAGRTSMGFKISGNPTIKAGEYLLITSRVPNSAQSAVAVPRDVQNASFDLDRDEYKQLVLKDPDGNVIDKTPESGQWPAGSYQAGDEYFSMQRVAGSKDRGEDSGSWQTCDRNDYNLNQYWKEPFLSKVCGTPGDPNSAHSNVNIENNETPVSGSESSSTEKTDADDVDKNENTETDKKEDVQDGVKDRDDTDQPQKYQPRDVMISEIHWAGSPASSNDQWIELHNTTNEDISLRNWTIENAGRTSMGFKISGNPTIKAGEYLLITSRVPNSAQSAVAVPRDVQNASFDLDRDEYKQLVLKDPDGNVIDETPESGQWPAGSYREGAEYFSMQRVSDNGWQTCVRNNYNLNQYWKEPFLSKVCGTPGDPNSAHSNVNIENNETPVSEPEPSPEEKEEEVKTDKIEDKEDDMSKENEDSGNE